MYLRWIVSFPKKGGGMTMKPHLSVTQISSSIEELLDSVLGSFEIPPYKKGVTKVLVSGLSTSGITY